MKNGWSYRISGLCVHIIKVYKIFLYRFLCISITSTWFDKKKSLLMHTHAVLYSIKEYVCMSIITVVSLFSSRAFDLNLNKDYYYYRMSDCLSCWYYCWFHIFFITLAIMSVWLFVYIRLMCVFTQLSIVQDVAEQKMWCVGKLCLSA